MGARKVLPASRTIATYVEEGTSLRSTQGVGVCFCPKNHDNAAAHSDSAGELNYPAAGGLKVAETK